MYIYVQSKFLQNVFPIIKYLYAISQCENSVGSIFSAFSLVKMRSMLEDIEEGELDYDEDGEVPDELEDLPDLPEYDPSIHKKENGGDAASEEGEIVSDGDVSIDFWYTLISLLCSK